MVLREDGDAVIAIGQPSHAWLSGQLARAWGNARFGAVEPREEVCLAAEQHDIGMAGWDAEPELNSETGRPRSFMEMALETHLALWTAAPHTVRTQSRYAALLVSMHGTGLYGRRDPSRLGEERAAAVRRYLSEQSSLQDRLLEELRTDPEAAGGADDATVARNRQLVWTWDSLSLALLLDWAPHETDEVPLADGSATTLSLRAVDGRHSLSPWPFSERSLSVRCEGRRLEGRFGDENEMRAALEDSPWTTLVFELVPDSHDA